MDYAYVTLPLGLTLGLLLVFRHRSTRDKPRGRKVLLGVLAGLGVGVLLNAAVELTGVGDRRQVTAAEAERFVREQMEAQANRKVDSVQLRERPGGGYRGEARVAGATYDVTVDVRGTEMAWQATKRDADGP